jgi:uncharacterized delta-60 repeat protein
MSRGSMSFGLGLESLESRQMFNGGALDTSFGGGVMTTPFNFDVQNSAVQADNKIVVVGTSAGGFTVGRLNANGTIDTTFGGGDGLVTTKFTQASTNIAQQVVVQKDGKILVAGVLTNNASRLDAQWALARYDAAGNPDSTFGNGGSETVIGVNLTTGITDLALQSNGKILFTSSYGHRGGIFSDDNWDFALVRLNTNGQLDGTFGDNASSGRKGYVITGIGGDEFANALAIQSDGKIVVGGAKGSFSGGDFALTRYTTDGRLDNSFDHDGKVTTYLASTASITALAIDGDRILAAGTSNGSNVITVERYAPNGALDGLGNGGLFAKLNNSTAAEVPDSILIPVSGKYLVVGHLEYNINTGKKPQVFALQYDYSARDQEFGVNGVAVFDATTAHLGQPEATLTNEGKVVVSGGRTALRFVAATPTVTLEPRDGIEGNSSGYMLFYREHSYNFSTRVYFTVGGTATPGADFTGPLNIRPIAKTLAARTGALIGVGGPRVGYIDIPAGTWYATASVNAVDDNQLEPVETVSVTAQDNDRYTLGPTKFSTMRIADNDDVTVNFQAPTNSGGGVGPAYYEDTGKVFGARDYGLTYGWDADNTANARIQHNAASPDFLYDSYNHLQKNGANRKWEIAVPNGLYQVTLAAGDPNAVDSVYKLNLENTLAVSGTPAGLTHWFKRTINVAVTDGRLTLTNAAGAVNNKINWIDIKAAPIDATVGPVTDNTPITLMALPVKPKVPLKPISKLVLN